MSTPPRCERPGHSNEFLLRPGRHKKLGWYSDKMTGNFCAIFAVIFVRASGDIIMGQWKDFKALIVTNGSRGDAPDFSASVMGMT